MQEERCRFTDNSVLMAETFLSGSSFICVVGRKTNIVLSQLFVEKQQKMRAIQIIKKNFGCRLFIFLSLQIPSSFLLYLLSSLSIFITLLYVIQQTPPLFDLTKTTPALRNSPFSLLFLVSSLLSCPLF